MPIYLHVFYGCFQVTASELSNPDSDIYGASSRYSSAQCTINYSETFINFVFQVTCILLYCDISYYFHY